MKYFTPEEATRTLPLVKRIVADILDTANQIRALFEKQDNNVSTPEIQRLRNQLEELFQELEDIGCSYKDWSFHLGLVDFPAIIDGEEVLLCWRSDEPSLKYYHDFESGFAGRKPIPEELLSGRISQNIP